MLKKILIVLVALWVVGTLFGEDDPTREAAAGTAPGTGRGTVADPPAEEVTPSPKPATSEKSAPASAPPTAKAAPVKPVTGTRPPRATYLVTRVVDGDTIELGNGESVRFVGIDTPERGACGYAEATANMERLVLGKRVSLGMSDEDRDRYDRLLRYVNVGRKDAGLNQINRGLAIARYDSRDGYGYHPRENKYIAADKATANMKCASPKPKPQPVAPAPAPAPAQQSAYYENCDAARAAGAAPVHRGDPGYGSHLDRDGDGVACE